MTRARDPVLTLFRGGFTLIFPEDLRGFTVWNHTGFDPIFGGVGQDPYLTRNPPLEIPLF